MSMKAIFLLLPNMNMGEILLIGLFLLVFFGAKRIPEFMKGLGKGVREFKDSLNDVKRDIEESGSTTDSAPSKKIEDPK